MTQRKPTNLSDVRFSQGVFSYRSADGTVRDDGQRYAYESGKAIYDVQMYAFGTAFKVNCQLAPLEPMHMAIVQHFNLRA